MESQNRPDELQPQEFDHEPTFFIDISEADLRRILEEHRVWGDSGGARGRRANLERANLVGADLHGASLAEANLYQANLAKANLQGASLSKANLQGAQLGGANLQKASLWEANMQDARMSLANLQGANLSQANLQRALLREANMQKANLNRAVLQGARLSLSNLHGANLGRANLEDATLHHAVLHETNLQEANMTEVQGLQMKQLRGANVSSAILPQGIESTDWLQHVEEASKKAGRLLLFVILGSIYAWLAIASTEDLHLITNDAVSPLPIIGTKIPLSSFYILAPIALVILYIYFHLYLQRLWEDLAAFPAVFPDGKTLDKKVYPWLMNGLIRAYIPQLKDRHLPFFPLQIGVSVLTAWCLVPLTLGYFTIGYLPRHDALGTAMHLLLFTGSIWMAITFFRNAGWTLKGHTHERFDWREARTDRRTKAGLIVLGATAFMWSLLFLGPINLPTVKLVSADLRGADLRGVQLDGAILDGADLRSALLDGANLNGAMMFSARLEHASLRGASLQGTDVKGGILTGVDLTNANLRNADFRGARLIDANFRNAELRGADFSRAMMGGAQNLTPEQLCRTKAIMSAELEAVLVGGVAESCGVELLMSPPAERQGLP